MKAIDPVVGLTAAGVLMSADVHLDLWADGFKDIHIIGPLFLLNGIGGLVLGIAVLTWRHWLPLLAAAGFGALTLAAFYVSVTRGLFGLHEVAGGTQQVLAEVSEYVALVAGLLAVALGGWRLPARRGARVPSAVHGEELLTRR